MQATTVPTKLNGIDTQALQGAIAQITADPAAGQTHWAVHSTWQGGTRSDHAVNGFEIGGNEVARRFVIHVDEPHELGGENAYANPQEYLMAALNACMMVGYAAVAALMGVKLTKLEVQLEGDIDLRGFLGIEPGIKPGYDQLRQTVHIAGDGTREQFERIHEVVKATSPNYFNLTTAIPLRSQLVID